MYLDIHTPPNVLYTSTDNATDNAIPQQSPRNEDVIICQR